MDITEFRTRRKQLEYDLTVAIAIIVSQFMAETKLSPSSISVNMVRSHGFEKEFADYIVGGVETKFDI
jgi:hypothetical protein